VLGEVQNPIISECYAPLSEPLRIYSSYVFENVMTYVTLIEKNVCMTELSFSMVMVHVVLLNTLFKSANVGTDFFLFEIGVQQNILIIG
jgi:hypothetical protein